MTPHEQTKALILAELDKMQAENERNIRAAMGEIKSHLSGEFSFTDYQFIVNVINDVTLTRLEIKL